jgi:hypothetical protein
VELFKGSERLKQLATDPKNCKIIKFSLKFWLNIFLNRTIFLFPALWLYCIFKYFL